MLWMSLVKPLHFGGIMSRKALFFDIDGTLFSEELKIVPESAKKAVIQTRKKGNLVFINSGRALSCLGPVKGIVESDGYLCGCGIYLEVGGEVVYSHRIPHERGLEIKKAIVDYGFDGILEGIESCYFQKGDSRMEMVRRLKKSLEKEGNLSPYGWGEDCYEFDKFCLIADNHSNREGLFSFLESDMQIIDRGDNFYECVPKGHSKATAIEMIMKKFGIAIEDVYVFGDSSNDLDMFRYAQNAVLMEKHDKVLEPYATFLTKTVEEDGIEYAMKNLGLL